MITTHKTITSTSKVPHRHNINYAPWAKGGRGGGRRGAYHRKISGAQCVGRSASRFSGGALAWLVAETLRGELGLRSQHPSRRHPATHPQRAPRGLVPGLLFLFCSARWWVSRKICAHQILGRVLGRRNWERNSFCAETTRRLLCMCVCAHPLFLLEYEERRMSGGRWTRVYGDSAI
jgi:hypothetical protein